MYLAKAAVPSIRSFDYEVIDTNGWEWLVKTFTDTARAYFIKLGEGGEWAKECIEKGIIKFGYRGTPNDPCLRGEWDEVKAFWIERRNGDKSTAANDTRQIRTYYEATSDDIFITFSDGYLWWCQPRGVPVVLAEEGGIRVRPTVDGWHNASITGGPLLIGRLSGKLAMTQMYRGTICEVRDKDYLLRRVTGQSIPELVEIEATEQRLVEQILSMVRLLSPEDFELMVELIFSRSGWQRQLRTGGTLKTIDLELLLPTTGERAFVQVKSRTDQAEFEAYAAAFAASDAYQRMFYVWHTGTLKELSAANITLWGPDDIGGYVLNAGLLAWLKDRVSAESQCLTQKHDPECNK